MSNDASDKQSQQKEQRPEATTQPGNSQAAPSGVPAPNGNPLPPPVVNKDGTITYDIGEK